MRQLPSRRQFRPALQPLEGRHLLAVTGLDFLSPAKLGMRMAVSLEYTDTPGEGIDATTWSYQCAYKGDTSTQDSVQSPSVIGAVIPMVIPGKFTVTATVYYYTTILAHSPPAPQDVSNSIDIPVPDSVTKGGAIGVPTPLGQSAQISDLIMAGGKPLGNYAMGSVQEKIDKFKMADGTEMGGTEGEFAPADPGGSFGLNVHTSTIDDKQFVGADPATWAGIPDGAKVTPDGWTQQLQYSWTMVGVAGNFEYSEPLPSLTWTWTKVDANNWATN